ncbi:MAG: hypothetical protein JSS14_22960 [Proteobacteria bacterium]|nr:hypothetical protein [Pseudomonadota bacterium]
MIAARRRARDIAEAQQIIDSVAAERDQALVRCKEYRDANAGNLALRVSALKELAKIDPTHPLVHDAALRERMFKHAANTINATSDWDQVRKFGQTFQIPGRP